jgi:hypothetical protein
MSAVQDLPSRSELEERPTFELECLYDDAVDPTELTIFAPEEEKLTTEWVTADRSAAVPLEEIR